MPAVFFMHLVSMQENRYRRGFLWEAFLSSSNIYDYACVKN